MERSDLGRCSLLVLVGWDGGRVGVVGTDNIEVLLYGRGGGGRGLWIRVYQHYCLRYGMCLVVRGALIKGRGE